jgi:hypothetical protein
MKKISTADLDLAKCTIVFADEDKIETSELADFLFLFRGVYAAGIQAIDPSRVSNIEAEPALLAKLVRERLPKLKVSEVDDLFRRDLGSYRLITERISHDSPTELVLYGSVLLILAAVILSGGKFELLGVFKADLPPIGKGIKHLREALTSKTRAPVGYGVKSRIIKLSKEELAELMRQDPTQRDRGGFQRFLVGLQSRVNKQTRKLEVSEADMDRIMRHGMEPKKGGWQARIRKIFGHHFDFDEDA